MGRIYFFFMFMLSLLICALAPNKYNHNYSIICVSISIINIIIYLIIKKKKNYFDFDNLFFVAYIFIMFYYTAYMYETDPYRYVFYQLYFDKNTLPFSAGLALLGLSGYIFGAMLVKNRTINITQNSKQTIDKTIATTPFYILSIIFLILYVVSGGYEKIMKEYIGGGLESVEDGGLSQYFFVFFPAFLLSGIIVEFHNLRIYNRNKIKLSAINKVGIFTTITIFLMFILIGSRTIPLQIALAIIGLYTKYYKPVTLSKFVGFVCAGFLLFALVGFLRSQSNDGREFKPEDAAMDFIINNRNSYVAIDYVNDNGLSYGESMLSPILAPFPFSQSLVVNLFHLNPDDMRSALITTKATFGEVGTWGLGTNIIADVYIAFGVLGVFIMFPLLGYYVNYHRENTDNSILSLVFYGVIISYAVYLPRAEYFYFLRYFIWCYIFIVTSIKIKKSKNA